MIRRFVVLLTVLPVLTLLPGRTALADACRLQLGFAALHALIPATVGSCLDDEAHNPANGDALQHTTGGLLVWRKADNWTAFTDGSRTWINGPDGLSTRPNTERFTWEANPDGLPIADGGDRFPPLPPRFVSGWYHHGGALIVRADGSATEEFRAWVPCRPGVQGPCDATINGQLIYGVRGTARFDRVSGDTAYGVMLTSTDPASIPLGPVTLHVSPLGKAALLSGNHQPPSNGGFWCGGPFWDHASSDAYAKYWDCGA